VCDCGGGGHFRRKLRRLETREITDLKNGGTEPTKGTDPLPERFSNSTRARFAREGGRDLTEHASARDDRACVFCEIPPSLQPAVPAGAASNSERRNWRSVSFVGFVAPFLRSVNSLASLSFSFSLSFFLPRLTTPPGQPDTLCQCALGRLLSAAREPRSHPTGSQPKTNLLPALIKRTPGVTEGRSACRARSRRRHLPTLFENKPGDG
jgi:hypothetical protein